MYWNELIQWSDSVNLSEVKKLNGKRLWNSLCMELDGGVSL